MSDARSKLVIVGIGDDGLAGLTESARRVVAEADLILGAPSTLRLLEGSRRARCRSTPTCPRPCGRCARRSTSPAGAGQRRRPALLRRRALPLRPPGQGPVRGRPARQQHATRLRPGQGELGGRLSDQPGRPAAGGGRGPDPDGREGRPVLQRRAPAVAAGARALWTGGSTTSGPTSARTWARPTSGSRRASWPTWPAMEFDPLNVLILVRKPNRPDRASRAAGTGSSATPTTPSPSRCPSEG